MNIEHLFRQVEETNTRVQRIEAQISEIASNEQVKQMSLLTDDQVITILGISKHTLNQWVSRGVIPVIKVGAKRRFDPVDLAEWIEERKKGVSA